MRERFKFSEQELGHRIWTIVQLFYRCHSVFGEQFESYEKKVLNLSRQMGIDRSKLRLNSADLGGLLDFKNLERIRDAYLHELKDLCHLVFRGQDRTDLLDRYVADIFHEISILKEEHYNVKTYAPLYEKDAAEVELKHILDEAHTLFPHKLRHIRYLFGRAQARLEEHLGSFRNIGLFIRSLYLHRADFIAEAYPAGLEQFYRFMYPLGPCEGYYEVGRSFYHAGFGHEALEALRLALAAYQRQLAAAPSPGPAPRQRLRELRRLILRKTARLEASLASQAAADPRAEIAGLRSPAELAAGPPPARGLVGSAGAALDAALP
jgi:hypothetical protein